MIINQIASSGGGGLDTSDATAYPEHILEGYTAYARGAKITGTYEPAGYIRYKNHKATPDPSCPSVASFSLTIPTDTQDGDLIVCCVMHRDIITAPAGFILAATQQVYGYVQYASIYYKVCNGDAGSTITFNQATSQRMGVEIIIAECVGEILIDTYNTTTNSTYPVTFPTVTASKDGGLCVFITNAVYAENTITLTGDSWITFNISSNVQRIAVATKHVNAGDVSGLEIKQTTPSINVSSISVVFTTT